MCSRLVHVCEVFVQIHQKTLSEITESKTMKQVRNAPDLEMFCEGLRRNRTHQNLLKTPSLEVRMIPSSKNMNMKLARHTPDLEVFCRVLRRIKTH